MGDLVDGTSYEFRVIAENKAGRSDPSGPNQPVVVREPVSGKAPRVTEHLVEEVGKIGDSATLRCRISGDPEPDLQW